MLRTVTNSVMTTDVQSRPGKPSYLGERRIFYVKITNLKLFRHNTNIQLWFFEISYCCQGGLLFYLFIYLFFFWSRGSKKKPRYVSVDVSIPFTILATEGISCAYAATFLVVFKLTRKHFLYLSHIFITIIINRSLLQLLSRWHSI